MMMMMIMILMIMMIMTIMMIMMIHFDRHEEISMRRVLSMFQKITSTKCSQKNPQWRKALCLQ